MRPEDEAAAAAAQERWYNEQARRDYLGLPPLAGAPVTRTMGDAIAGNSAALPRTIDLVAGYDTGTVNNPPVRWGTSDWALFPGAGHVHIDQGGPGAPVYTAHVIDIEDFAYTPVQAQGWINHCTQPRPTIYVNRSNLAASIASAKLSPKWKGDIWISFPGWTPDNMHGVLPALPAGCQYVAVQNQLDVQGAYDLSVVLDPHWPLLPPKPKPPEDPMATNVQSGWLICDKCGCLFWPHGDNPRACAGGGTHDAGPNPVPYVLLYDK